jgi:hypothetical protein
MATKGGNQKTRVANPMLTKTGKTRLGPLSLKQLAEMLEKSSKPKEKNKIETRIRTLKNILQVGKFKVVEVLK